MRVHYGNGVMDMDMGVDKRAVYNISKYIYLLAA